MSNREKEDTNEVIYDIYFKTFFQQQTMQMLTNLYFTILLSNKITLI